jgi:hypothetical protein
MKPSIFYQPGENQIELIWILYDFVDSHLKYCNYFSWVGVFQIWLILNSHPRFIVFSQEVFK